MAWNQFPSFRFRFSHTFLRRCWNLLKAEMNVNQFAFKRKQLISIEASRCLTQLNFSRVHPSRHWSCNCSKSRAKKKSKIKRNEKLFFLLLMAPDTKEIKNFMRIGSSKLHQHHQRDALFVGKQNKQKSLFFLKMMRCDAFSSVIVDEIRGWNSSLLLLWKHKIMMEDSSIYGLENAQPWSLEWPTRWKWKQKFETNSNYGRGND